MKISAGLVSLILACLLVTANAQNAEAIVDAIGRSLSEVEPGWKLSGKDIYTSDDGSAQASLRWTDGTVEKGATIIVHTGLKAAKREFRPHGKDDLQEAFRIDGIGDEAFLWPPVAPKDGAYNIRFRKAQVEVWMSGRSEEEVKRFALAIAAAIPPPT